MGVEHLGQFTVMILHAVTLVDDHVLPLDLGQGGLVLDDVLVRGEQHVELACLQGGLHLLAVLWRTLVLDLDHTRCPPLELQHPIGERGKWHNDQERTVNALLLHQVGDQRNGLNCFAETLDF